MALASVTFWHESSGILGKAAILTIKLDKQKFRIRSGEKKTVTVEPGRHKIIFTHGKALLTGLGGIKLKSKIKVNEGEKIGYKCGIKRGLTGKKIFYELYDLKQDV